MVFVIRAVGFRMLSRGRLFTSSCRRQVGETFFHWIWISSTLKKGEGDIFVLRRAAVRGIGKERHLRIDPCVGLFEAAFQEGFPSRRVGKASEGGVGKRLQRTAAFVSCGGKRGRRARWSGAAGFPGGSLSGGGGAAGRAGRGCPETRRRVPGWPRDWRSWR